MDSVIIFNHEYKSLMSINIKVTNPPSFVPAPKTIEVKAGTRDEKIGNWLFRRFNRGDEIRMEIQRGKKEKLVIKNARIIKIRPTIAPNELTLTTIMIVSENFIYEEGLIGKEVWSVS